RYEAPRKAVDTAGGLDAFIGHQFVAWGKSGPIVESAGAPSVVRQQCGDDSRDATAPHACGWHTLKDAQRVVWPVCLQSIIHAIAAALHVRQQLVRQRVLVIDSHAEHERVAEEEDRARRGLVSVGGPVALLVDRI